MDVKSRQIVSLRHQHVDPATGLKQIEEPPLALDDDRAAQPFDEFRVTDELDRVTKALFSMKEDRSPDEGLALPQRLPKSARLRFPRFPPPFIRVPASFQFALKQIQDRLVPM